MVQVLPMRAGVPFQQSQVDLDGVPFNVELRWNERAPAWVMTLRDASGAVLRAGVRVCLGAELLPAEKPSTFPAGTLLAVDTSDSGVDAGLDELGADARVRLVYLEAADVAGVAGA